MSKSESMLTGSVLPLALLAVALTACAPGPRPQQDRLSPAERALALESFDFAWQRIADRHYDPDMGGVNWDGVRAELRPRVELARTNGEVHAVLSDMVSRLGLSHYGVLARRTYEGLAMEGESGGGDGAAGFEVRVHSGRVLVSRVDSSSQAHALGIRPGWELTRVDGRDTTPLVEAVSEQGSHGVSLDLTLNLALSRRLAGSVGSELELEFVAGDGTPVSTSVVLEESKGHVVSFGNIPRMRVAHEWRVLPSPEGDVGYFSLSSFFDPASVMPAFGEATRKSRGLRGMILDLRGNLGGISGMAMGMAGWLVGDKSLYLGTLKTRESEIRFIVNPRLSVYEGPLAVLVDAMTASTSEILAGGLQDLGRARVFGQRTAGAALPSAVERLPNGDMLQYVMANYISASGSALEGEGVTPDLEIPMDRKTLLTSDDPVLEAALDWITRAASSGASR